MAAALFKKYTGIEAMSAGTEAAHHQGKTLADMPAAEPVIRFMAKEGIDISGHEPTQVTAEMLAEFDTIIVMAEPETIPKYLENSENTEYWEIEDPKGKDDDGYREIITQLKQHLRQFIEENDLGNAD